MSPDMEEAWHSLFGSGVQPFHIAFTILAVIGLICEFMGLDQSIPDFEVDGGLPQPFQVPPTVTDSARSHHLGGAE